MTLIPTVSTFANAELSATVDSLRADMTAMTRNFARLQRQNNQERPKPLFNWATQDRQFPYPSVGASDSVVTAFVDTAFELARQEYPSLGFDIPDSKDYITLYQAADDARRGIRQPYRGYPQGSSKPGHDHSRRPSYEANTSPVPAATGPTSQTLPPNGAKAPEAKPLSHITWCPYHPSCLFDNCPDKLQIIQDLRGEHPTNYPLTNESDLRNPRFQSGPLVSPQFLYSVASFYFPDTSHVPHAIWSTYNKFISYDESVNVITFESFIQNHVPTDVPLETSVYIPESDHELSRFLIAVQAYQQMCLVVTPPRVSAANALILHDLSYQQPLMAQSSPNELHKILHDPTKCYTVWTRGLHETRPNASGT
ncbi:hypothetical protein HDU67_007530 [Dinochytrium kinnereticum]|nr:hypothetical protein HDU67_007530 [Dinochytrium kinnereticum]